MINILQGIAPEMAAFWTQFAINQSLSEIRLDSQRPLVPFGALNGGTFGRMGSSALLYLADPAASSIGNEELCGDEQMDIGNMQNGGDFGVSEYSALHILAIMLEEVD